MKKLLFAFAFFVSLVASSQPISTMPVWNAKADSGFYFPAVYYSGHWINVRIPFTQLQPDPSTTNYRSDTVLLYALNTSQSLAASGWTKNSAWASNTTESAVSTGLRFANSAATSYNYLNSAYTNYESSLNDATTSVTYVINTKGSTAPLVGIYLQGATNQIAITFLATLNLANGEVRNSGYDWANTLVGTVPFSFSNGDSVNIKLRRRNSDYYYVISNRTTKNVFRCESHETTLQGPVRPFIGDVKPGVYVGEGTYTLTDFRYYAHNYQPDLLVIGSSVSALGYGSELAGGTKAYDSSIYGRLASSTNLRIALAAKAANALSDALESLDEVLKMKPKTVMIEAGINDVYFSIPGWQAKYLTLVDSLLKAGINVVVQKLAPNVYINEGATVNAFIDSAYGSHPFVSIVNLTTTTPLYNSASPDGITAGYSVDGTHLNTYGTAAIASYLKTQLQAILQPKTFSPYASYAEGNAQNFSSSSTPSIVTLSTTIIQTGISINSSEITFSSAGNYQISYSANATATAGANLEVRLQRWNGSAYVDVPYTKIAFSLTSTSGIANAANTIIFSAMSGDKIRFAATATSASNIGLVAGNTDYSFMTTMRKL